MKEYQKLQLRYTRDLDDLATKFDWISGIRLLFALAFVFNLYLYLQPGNSFLIILLPILAIAFLLAVREHQKVSWKKLLKKTLKRINVDEASYLDGKKIPFGNGAEFINPTHAFSHDLDFFGEHSLFHNLNRTSTRMGNRVLASSLTSTLSPDEIVKTQSAIKELEPNVDWRQEVQALGMIKQDDEESYKDLLSWARKERPELSKAAIFASYAIPSLVIPSLVIYFTTPLAIFGNISLLLFVINLLIVGLHKKRIEGEIIGSTEIDKVLRQYSLILEKVEQEEFKSARLKELQDALSTGQTTASIKISQLSTLFGQLDHVQNVFASPLLNGLFLFHMHTLRSLDQWRAKWARHVYDWLEVIGNVEALNSLAHFAHNNPEYVYPELNENQTIEFQNLGHPLINSETRVNNDVTFNTQSFFILTGSNMSGKSTFLRTLGVNMVLTSIGAPVCASAANVHPLPVLVSMRMSDSLNESESYFFAEVKRLKKIMDSLDRMTGFVLLDEILRGTNSDDKRSGTIEVIRKMVEKKAIGVIATHDLEVCKTEKEDPEKLANKCFEVEIQNNELVFDYKLREGICKNKSATFLMEKIGVI